MFKTQTYFDKNTPLFSKKPKKFSSELNHPTPKGGGLQLLT